MPDLPLDWAKQTLGRQFRSPALLQEALSHPSLAGGAGGMSYERLEFLGDRVLGCVMAAWIFERFPSEPEGRLARRLAELVRRETCAQVARSAGVAVHVRMDRTAANARVNHSDSVLGDVCEALIGALYLDGGMSAARKFIYAAWQPLIESPEGARKDAKSALQEWAQGRGLPLPEYRETGRFGPDHAPSFTVEVCVRGQGCVQAEGANKQEAQMRAAHAMLAKLTALPMGKDQP
jgi:ribonuclease III